MRKSSFGVWIVFALGVSGMAMASPGKVAPPPASEQPVAAAEAPWVSEVRPFDFLDVETKAKELSKQSYRRDDSGMPESLLKLDYMLASITSSSLIPKH